MLLLIGNLSVTEVLVVVLVAVMIFGRRLPEVAVKTAREVHKLRVQLLKTWRETGLQDEIREIRREVDGIPRDLSPRSLAGGGAKDAWRRIETETIEIDAPAVEHRPAETAQEAGEGTGRREASGGEGAEGFAAAQQAPPEEVAVSPDRPRLRPEPPPRRADWTPAPTGLDDGRREPPSEPSGSHGGGVDSAEAGGEQPPAAPGSPPPA